MATVSSTYRQQKDTAARRGKGKAAQLQRSSSSAAAAGKASPSSGPDPELVEAALRQFDLSTEFGPCTGMTRLQRWQRAERLGLNPPAEIKQFVEEYGGTGESLWHNRL